MVRQKKVELAREMVLKLFTTLTFIAFGHPFRHLGFTFLIGLMTEVLGPYIGLS
jgi:hypothetical protein